MHIAFTWRRWKISGCVNNTYALWHLEHKTFEQLVRFSINGLQGKQSSESQSLFVTKGPEWQTSAGWLLFAHHLSAQSRTLCLTSLRFTCSRIVRPNPGFMVPMVTWAILILFFHQKFTIDAETEMILQLYFWVKQNKTRSSSRVQTSVKAAHALLSVYWPWMTGLRSNVTWYFSLYMGISIWWLYTPYL